MVGYHYTGIRTRFWGAPPSHVFPTLNEFTRYGYLGVELFFIISGFVILMTAYNRPVERFTASRVARLFPAYWAAIVLTIGLQLLWHSGRQPSFVDNLLNFTMVQGAFDATNVQGAFWTLWIELKFYLLIGVFILVGITRRRVIAFAVLWPLLAVLASATHSGLLVSLLSPTYAPYFGIGMLMFLLYREGHSTILWLGIAFTGALCLRQAITYARRATELVGQPVSPVVTGLTVVAMVAAIWFVTLGAGSRIGWRWLTTLGLLTYPLYLVHGQFGFYVIDELHGRLNGYLVLALALTVSLLLAIALHYGIENRFHDRLRDAVAKGLSDRSESVQSTPAPKPARMEDQAHRPGADHADAPKAEPGAERSELPTAAG